MVTAALEGAESAGAETELLLLRKLNIGICGGCGKCSETHTCHKEDDMQEIYGKLFSADAVVLGTPCYFSNMSGSLKNFIDRLNPYWEDGRLQNKFALLLCVGAQGGKSLEACLRSLHEFCSVENWRVIAEVSAKAEKAGEVSKDGLEKCGAAGKMLGAAAKLKK